VRAKSIGGWGERWGQSRGRFVTKFTMKGDTTMRRFITRLAALSAVLVASLIAIPASVAGASGNPNSLWVSNVSPLVAAPGTSCTHPGYSTIQSAINAAAPSATIHICAST
jgi:hypothetical protein